MSDDDRKTPEENREDYEVSSSRGLETELAAEPDDLALLEDDESFQIESEDDEEGIGSYRKRSRGPRSQRALEIKKARKRKTRRTIMAVVLLSAVAAAGVIGGAAFLSNRRDVPTQTAEEKPGAAQETWLVMGTVEADPSKQADWMSIMSFDKKRGSGLVLYLPRSTFSEIPGHGLETIDKSLALGGEPLAQSTVSNLLGVEFDHYLRISDQALQALFDRVGPLEIQVDQKLTRAEPDGKVITVFSEGVQTMDGKRAAEYLAFTTENGDEISRGNRHSGVWLALFEKFKGKGTDLGKAFAASFPSFVTDANEKDVAAFAASFASAKTDPIFETMPVKATGVDSGIQLYAPEREAVEQLVDRYLQGSRPGGSSKTGRRVEILNGNGEPGIGQEVSAQLIAKGFRVILDQNANRFDYATTQIVVYSDAKAALATGNEIKQILGVGEVIISRQSQSVVDVTVVVGKDYLDARG